MSPRISVDWIRIRGYNLTEQILQCWEMLGRCGNVKLLSQLTEPHSISQILPPRVNCDSQHPQVCPKTLREDDLAPVSSVLHRDARVRMLPKIPAGSVAQVR